MRAGWENKDSLIEQINLNVIINFPAWLIYLHKHVLLLTPACPNQACDDWLAGAWALLILPAEWVSPSSLFPSCAPPLLSTSLHLSGMCELVAGVSVKGWFFCLFVLIFKAGPQVAQSGLGLAVCWGQSSPPGLHDSACVLRTVSQCCTAQPGHFCCLGCPETGSRWVG